MAGPTDHSSSSSSGSNSRFYSNHYGFHPRQPAFRHRWGAKLLGATMWFWMFYRAKQDGAVLLGLRHPWEGHHGDDHHDEHDH